MTLRDNIIHGLRMAGWSRIDAEDEADERLSRAPCDTLPKGQDAKQGLAGTEGSAVPEGQTPVTSGNHSSETPVE